MDTRALKAAEERRRHPSFNQFSCSSPAIVMASQSSVSLPQRPLLDALIFSATCLFSCQFVCYVERCLSLVRIQQHN